MDSLKFVAAAIVLFQFACSSPAEKSTEPASGQSSPSAAGFRHSHDFVDRTIETDSWNAIQSKVDELGDKHGEDSVLVVLDLDNTLLTMETEIGSDQWFGWQYDILGHKKNRARVAGDFGGLLHAQGILFHLGSMRVTERQVPEIVQEIQSKGYPTIILTSRGHDFRLVTFRELRRNWLNFRDSAIGPKGGYRGPYYPYETNALTLNLPNSPENELSKSLQIFTPDEVTRFKLTKPRKVLYEDGVYMTAGQHKGAMLRLLMEKTGQKYKTIVFVDDHDRNTKRVQEAFIRFPETRVTTFRYNREDARVKAFQAKPAQARKEWVRLKKALPVLQGIYGDSYSLPAR